jgi:hypothetical protein
MFVRLAKKQVNQSLSANQRFAQALNRPSGSITSIPFRASSAMELTGLQMHNKMFLTKSVLERQVAIMKDEKIPK